MTPPPAAPPSMPAVQTQMRVEERAPVIAVPPAAKSGSRALLVVLLVLLGIGIVGGGAYAALRFLPKYLNGISPEDLALAAEAKQFWNDHKLDDSLADWRKLADHAGPLHDSAMKQVNDLVQQQASAEQKYAEGMKLLYEEKKYPEASAKFNEVIQMNSWKLDEAHHEFDIANKGPSSDAPAEPIWQAFFDEGKRAFDKKDYAAAAQDFEQVTQANGVSKDVSAQTAGLLLVVRDRSEQKKEFDDAMRLEKSGRPQQAKDLFTRVVRASNGDLDLVASAKNQIDQIGAIPEPQPNAGGNGSNGNGSASKPSADYSAAIGEVKDLIGQARWDDATAKLGAVPASEPEFGQLKAQIETGRGEDKYYSQMKSAFNGAHESRNKDALLTLRPYFTTEVGKADRHSDDARTIVTEIDGDLRDAVLSSQPIGGSNGNNGSTANAKGNDPAAITDVLNRYAAALDSGDMLALSAVRQLSAKDQDKIQNILDSVKGKGYQIQDCRKPQLGRTTATITCNGVFTKSGDSKPQAVNFVLRRVNGQWMIVSQN